MKIIPQMAISNTTNFSRASTKTYFDKNGAMQTAAIDEPVWTYDINDLEALPLPSIEPQAANYILQSNNQMLSPWQAGVGGFFTATASPFESPMGTDSTKYVFVSTAALFLRQGSLSLASSTWWYVSIFVYIPSQSGVANWRMRADFNDIDYSQYTTNSNIFDKWVRVTFVILTTAARTIVDFEINVNGITPPVGFNFYSFGVQLEPWGLTSYIPTTTSAVIRSADIIPMMTSNVLENDHPAWSAATTYALDDRVIVVTASSHKVYNSVQAGNLNHIPVGGVADLWWELVGETNRWKCFDGYVSSQTVADVGVDFIGTAIQTTGFLDSVSLNNIDAEEVRIQQVDTTEGTVYDQTYSLISDSGITDYWEYFFAPIERLSNFAVTDLLLYENTQVYVTLSDVGGNAKIGALVLGLGVDFGYAQYGLSLGMRDYSVNIEDDFGNVTILRRGYRDMMNLTVMVENPSLGAFKKFLAGLRATPAIFIGVDEYGEATNVFGYYEDWGLVISYPEHSLLTISTKGLLNGSF